MIRRKLKLAVAMSVPPAVAVLFSLGLYRVFPGAFTGNACPGPMVLNGHEVVATCGVFPFADHDWPDARSADLGDADLGFFAPLYRTDWQDVKPGIATVPPEAVTDHTIATWREREALGIGRLVAHYMQPHEPYITRPDWGSGDHKLLENLIDPSKEAGSSIWPRLQDGEINMDEFWAVYMDNLRWVLDDVTERLLPNVQGRVVLTADHGNALGEWGEWHHPPGAIGPSVRRVPWVGVDASDSGSVLPDRNVRRSSEGAEEVKSQLQALGYV